MVYAASDSPASLVQGPWGSGRVRDILHSPNLGPARGSGVLVRDGTTWKIAQYNLSVPIPNAVFADVKKIIAAAAKDNKPAPR
jgi:hypothetical protein